MPNVITFQDKRCHAWTACPYSLVNHAAHPLVKRQPQRILKVTSYCLLLENTIEAIKVLSEKCGKMLLEDPGNVSSCILHRLTPERHFLVSKAIRVVKIGPTHVYLGPGCNRYFG